MLIDNKLHAVVAVTALNDYFLLLEFENNEKRLKDMKPHIVRGMFAPLQDQSLFNSVHLENSTITWDNDLDMCPDTLYATSTPVGKLQSVLAEVVI